MGMSVHDLALIRYWAEGYADTPGQLIGLPAPKTDDSFWWLTREQVKAIRSTARADVEQATVRTWTAHMESCFGAAEVADLLHARSTDVEAAVAAGDIYVEN
ncbi:hypothetical protein H489_0106900 [Curtobacterium flaccumfaciens UCD-AKU]|nr:hypothetical protein H489_0106900 [Curtobacterium flaccumfaciens UCD-AKU]